ncbi:hypothetical protein B566_EDAN006248 [Ephemera danica]|nr:hypothetical protein B566_EDAN006248 [Ephemera danica]
MASQQRCDRYGLRWQWLRATLATALTTSSTWTTRTATVAALQPSTTSIKTGTSRTTVDCCGSFPRAGEIRWRTSSLSLTASSSSGQTGEILTRYAITLWYFDATEREEACRRYQKERLAATQCSVRYSSSSARHLAHSHPGAAALKRPCSTQAPTASKRQQRTQQQQCQDEVSPRTGELAAATPLICKAH